MKKKSTIYRFRINEILKALKLEGKIREINVPMGVLSDSDEIEIEVDEK